MPTADRCPTCDREDCPAACMMRSSPALYTDAQCVAAGRDCRAHAIDWRARCLAAESERDAMREVCEAAEAWVRGEWATARHKREDLVRAIVVCLSG